MSVVFLFRRKGEVFFILRAKSGCACLEYLCLVLLSASISWWGFYSLKQSSSKWVVSYSKKQHHSNSSAVLKLCFLPVTLHETNQMWAWSRQSNTCIHMCHFKIDLPLFIPAVDVSSGLFLRNVVCLLIVIYYLWDKSYIRSELLFFLIAGLGEYSVLNEERKIKQQLVFLYHLSAFRYWEILRDHPWPAHFKPLFYVNLSCWL